MNLRRTLASPRRLRLEAKRLRSKWTARLLRRDRAVLRLEPEGTSRGEVLVSYILDGVRQALAGNLEHSHTHFWESHRIAQTFVDLGYSVDVVHWQNRDFHPTRDYRAAVDVRSNLERWAPSLPTDCQKIFHGETAHWSFHQQAQDQRYRWLEQRRGVQLPRIKPAEANQGIETADIGFILGNDFTLGTYAFAGKPLESLSISTTSAYSELERDSSSARRFLWFGSGDLVHKGLDLVLEAIAQRPHMELVICGPVHREPDFERHYERELYGLPNIRTYGWIDTRSQDFLDIATSCSALIYPSCSEGQCGGVVTCMHAGLVPIVTRQCGLTIEPSVGITLSDEAVQKDPLAAVGQALDEHAERGWDELLESSARAASLARANHTREQFSARYRELAGRVLGAE